MAACAAHKLLSLIRGFARWSAISLVNGIFSGLLMHLFSKAWMRCCSLSSTLWIAIGQTKMQLAGAADRLANANLLASRLRPSSNSLQPHTG